MVTSRELNKNNIIGKGWQYTVYDLGNGRVYKKFNPYQESFKIILRDRWYIFWMVPSLIREMKVNAMRSLDFLDQFLTQHPMQAVLFGNYKRINELDIEQDKVISLKVYFKNHPLEENKIVIDQFVELCRLFYGYGFMDKALKIGDNFGVNKNGQIVLMDIGEIWFDEKSVEKQIKNRVWRSWWWTRCVPRKLRKYYLQEMDRVFLGD